MRLLVSGGAGFIGGATVERLLAAGHEVVVVDACSEGPTSARQKRATLARLATRAGFVHVDADILAGAELAGAVGPLDGVVHLAACSSVAPSMAAPAEYARVNVLGTCRVLELAAATGATRVVLASSSSVYGDAGGAPQHEGLPATAPESPYGASKRAAEMFVASWAAGHGARATALRFFTVYGPGQRPDMVVHRFMHAIARGEPVRIRPRTARDFVHVDDCARAIELALERGGPSYDVFNVGRGVATPLEELAHRVAATIGKPLVVGEPPAAWSGDVGHTVADTRRAAEGLGFGAAIDLDVGLASAWRWQRDEAG